MSDMDFGSSWEGESFDANDDSLDGPLGEVMNQKFDSPENLYREILNKTKEIASGSVDINWETIDSPEQQEAIAQAREWINTGRYEMLESLYISLLSEATLDKSLEDGELGEQFITMTNDMYNFYAIRSLVETYDAMKSVME